MNIIISTFLETSLLRNFLNQTITKMGKVKNLEKKDKATNAFDKKTPSSRVKSLNNEPKKAKTEKNDSDKIKTLLKKNKKEVIKALKAKASLITDATTPEKKEPAVAPAELANEDTIFKAVNALRQGLEKEAASSESKGLFDEETRFGVQVIAMKIPEVPPQARRILLDYSLLSEPIDICFIVRDTASKKTADHDKTISAMEAKLKELGVTGIKTIIPLSKLKEDYGPNNMKIKLLHMYDLFLVESEIAEHTYTILGKHFITKRKRPAQIDLSKTETVLMSIEHAKRKVSFKLGPSSNTSFIEVGTLKMPVEQVVANIQATLEQLKEKYPGGWLNIKKLLLKPGKISKVIIPIYYSKITFKKLVAPNDVSVPKEKGFKAARVEKLGKEVSKKTKLVMDKTSKNLVKVKPQSNKPAAVGSPKKGDKAKGKKTKSDGSPAKGKKPKEKKSHITGDDEATKEARALDRAEKKLKFKKQIEKKMAKKAAKLAEKKPNAPGTPKTETTESSEVNKINKQKDKKKAKKAKKAENALTESQAETVVEKPAGEKKKKKSKKEVAE